ncbi:TAXI family TRAP transporter solute-binding subunit [Isoptericola sp. NEAU-Y5]|uniref:TAXI family TRAP transporter solute-binding subunit n=1 Tax=Isoptericola luteus TaxID=2879484 RepID=A0ABS7ZI03_9MICO|nr:TAXI family TRAP transporter solute-binding subunit [Isoptericola sp. NEAU-Y5]MCA5894659.1 TAXI family TRAP transporter solute-binding subunit [Isoptericola sp. NEAU-Y5]
MPATPPDDRRTTDPRTTERSPSERPSTGSARGRGRGRRRGRAYLVAVVAGVLVALGVVLVLTGALGGVRTSDPWDGARPSSLVITTGSASGIYHGYGAAVGDVLERRYGVPVSESESGGSIENLQRLADGTAQVGFSAADAVADAVAGRGDFSEPVPVSALARVYDDFVHLVVRAESPVETIGDLRGRTVSLGAPASGTALIAHRVLAAAEVGEDELDTRSLGLAESIDSLRAGDIDAFFWSGGLRTPGLTELADELPIQLVPLGDLVEDVRVQHGGGYRHGVVPQGMYGGAQPVATLAVPNFLVVRTDMPEPVVRVLVETLFDARSQITATVPSAALLDRARAIFTDPVPLHPGALRYFRDTKT